MSKRTQRIGIEYELEGLEHSHDEWEHYNGRIPNWCMVGDGTLRGRSGEFVSSILDLDDASADVKAMLDAVDGNYELSHRCSMHMHISIDGLCGWQRLALYMMLVAEEAHFFQFNPERAKNHYCTPLLYTPAFYQGLCTMTRTPDWEKGRPLRDTPTLPMRQLYSSSCKYTSVNTQPALHDGIGTIELRHFTPLMEIEQVDTVLATIRRITDLAHECPSIDSDAVYAFLLSQADKFNNESALTWVVEAVRQLQGELPQQAAQPTETRSERLRRQRMESLSLTMEDLHATTPSRGLGEAIDLSNLQFNQG